MYGHIVKILYPGCIRLPYLMQINIDRITFAGKRKATPLPGWLRYL